MDKVEKKSPKEMTQLTKRIIALGLAAETKINQGEQQITLSEIEREANAILSENGDTEEHDDVSSDRGPPLPQTENLYRKYYCMEEKTMTSNAEFAEWLRSERIKRNLTHEEIGFALKKSDSYMKAIENEEIPMTATVYGQLCRLFALDDIVKYAAENSDKIRFLREIAADADCIFKMKK